MQANAVVRMLNKEEDFTYDEKTKGVQLTEDGINKAEKAFGIENLFDITHVTLNHHIQSSVESPCQYAS